MDQIFFAKMFTPIFDTVSFRWWDSEFSPDPLPHGGIDALMGPQHV
jgi:hypothetical protein